MSKPSPATHAVWNAFLDRYEWNATTEELFAVAAALRATADQVVPEKLESYGMRYKLLKIADELEAL